MVALHSCWDLETLDNSGLEFLISEQVLLSFLLGSLVGISSFGGFTQAFFSFVSDQSRDASRCLSLRPSQSISTLFFFKLFQSQDTVTELS